jgi:hypothetical protein
MQYVCQRVRRRKSGHFEDLSDLRVSDLRTVKCIFQSQVKPASVDVVFFLDTGYPGHFVVTLICRQH